MTGSKDRLNEGTFVCTDFVMLNAPSQQGIADAQKHPLSPSGSDGHQHILVGTREHQTGLQNKNVKKTNNSARIRLEYPAGLFYSGDDTNKRWFLHKILQRAGVSLTNPRKGSIRKKIWKQRWLLLMLLPGLIWFIVFKYATYAGLALSFTNYGFRKTVSFVGLRNFERLFRSASFWNAFRNTLLISLYNIVFYFPFPILIALLINELRSVHSKRLVQFLIYIPYFFSWVVVGSIFVNLLSPSSGIVNQILKSLGMQSIYFMSDIRWFRKVLIVSYIWKQMGYGAVIYVATLSTVDPQLYEAAEIDGCGKFRQVLSITLPTIRPTIITMLLLNLSHVLMIFDQIMVMYNASVYSVSDVLQTYSYREGILTGNLGFGTAVSLFVGIVSLCLVLGTNWISKHFLEDSIL